MRLDFAMPDAQSRRELGERLARLQQRAALVTLLREGLPDEPDPENADATLVSLHPDRFVLRVATAAGRVYACKAYVGDRGRELFALHRQIAADCARRHVDCPVWSPLAYLPSERLLISPWLDGPTLSGSLVDDGRPQLLAAAAAALATLHGSAVAPEAPTPAATILAATRARGERLCRKWPEAADLVRPLLLRLAEIVPVLDAALPVLVHGDAAPEHFLWASRGPVLLDLDMFGCTEAAYDVGHFLAQLERLCLSHPRLAPRASASVATFRDAYLAVMPVSARNIAFYHGLSLTRKLSTVRRLKPQGWTQLVPILAARARSALTAAMEGDERGL